MQQRVRFVRAQDEAETVVVARQPILDHLERIVAFELLTPQDEEIRAKRRRACSRARSPTSG